ncbi:hypothetical protein I6L24_03490 [Acinetobacter lwoffii]|uniref:NAD(P)-dependent oxidoreductase n=1 Tax=Acinetobacter TaxID=469 RepID=UPI0015D184C0|nr:MULTISPECIES: NAD(P)-dependent oxidoreductase [Acinetobacter]QXB86681.1 hypothetical protein I6L24_03490 [Acinetobacter lwoffii]
MTVLVTGSNGNLGRAIINCFEKYNIRYIPYSHSMSLSDIDWSSIKCIVNCAGVIPSSKASNDDYLSGNVIYLQKLLEYSKDKQFIHFSTFSEIYKADFYQKSKMLANSLLLINSNIFENLHILPLPTLDDINIINSIVSKAMKGEKPVVDELIYNYMSFNEVAELTKNLVSNTSSYIPISNYYTKKNLYDEVIKIVEPNLIIKGKYIDRALFNNGIYYVMPSLINSLAKED